MKINIEIKKYSIFALLGLLLYPALSQASVVAQSNPGANFSLTFSTYFGGSGWEELREVVTDSAGDIIVVGHGGSSSHEFPSARKIGPLGGGSDVYVAKFTKDGSRLLWLTLIGGSGVDRGYGLDLGPSGYIYVAGQTGSLDFPTTAGAWDKTNNGGCTSPSGPHGCPLDAYVLKLTPDGANLIYSTYLGGSGIEGARGGLAVDSQGAAYVVGYTFSQDFLDEGGISNSAKVNSYLGGMADGFITKVSANGSSIVYSRYIGGAIDASAYGEVAVGVRVDSQGQAYIHTLARSTDAFTTTGAYQKTFGGGESDAYFAKLSSDGRQLLYATYFGGNGAEFGEHRIDMDSQGNAYFSGYTNSANFPLINAYQAVKSGGYLVKLDPVGQPIFSTYVAGMSSFGPALTSSGDIFIAGRTSDPNFEVTANAYQKVKKTSGDVGFQVYDSTGRLLYGTFLGGSGDEIARFVGADAAGNAILVGKTDSLDFPTTSGAFDRTLNGTQTDAFIAKFSPLSAPLLGDLNSDNKVDIHDYNLLVADFKKTGSPGFTPADIDKDGDVDIFDYNLLVQNFGKVQ